MSIMTRLRGEEDPYDSSTNDAGVGFGFRPPNFPSPLVGGRTDIVRHTNRLYRAPSLRLS